MKVWIEVSEERLAQNFRTVSQAAGADTTMLAVVKANAYGHGAERCSAMLARAGTQWLGVTCADEGARVRRFLEAAGFPLTEARTPQILVMSGSLPEDTAVIVEHALTPVVWTAEQVRWLSGTALSVHVEVDTGMGRQGVQPGPAFDELLTAIATAGLTLDGVFTHFCASEVAHSTLTQTQQRRFETAARQVIAKGIQPTWIHAGNSSTVDNPAEPSPWLKNLAATAGACAMVRSGTALYGYCLPIEHPASGPVQPHIRNALQPVMTWKTRVLAIRNLLPGDTVGYGATFVAPAPMRVALLPVGYADGLRRELSSSTHHPGGWVMLRNKKAPILGRVSMNLTVVDVTSIHEVQTGDEAILLGDGITAEDHARLAKTIAYEILCAVRER